jgi:hypothetical protein
MLPLLTTRRTFLQSVSASALSGVACATTEPNTERTEKSHTNRPRLLPPREIPWTLRDWTRADTRLSYDDDGRMRLSITHEVLRGVTPPMLLWWFNNLEGTMEVEGRVLPRYHVWHPIDHIDFWTTGRGSDGRVIPGTVFHIVEAFGGNPDYMVNAASVIEKLDETGLIHAPQMMGLKAAHMEYEFIPTDEGTLYRNFLLVGPDAPGARHAATAFRGWLFPVDKGYAWMRHNVEEVGLFEQFLPKLFRDVAR